MKKSHLLLASSFSALGFALAAPAAAQPQNAAGADVEEVIVSASRINISGYEQPTPVTVVNTEALERDAQAALGGLFRSLPAFGVAASPDTNQGAQAVSGGGAGSEAVNLRNMGTNRTLVLLNGVRVVGSELTGTSVDVGVIPTMLISRVDIVTAGASAAWGSDAVAGVVNFVMDDRFTGFKASLDGTNNAWLNKATGAFNAAYGSDFAGGRGHAVVGFSYYNSPMTPLLSEADWREPGDYIALITNPAYTATNGQPQLIHAHNVKYSTKSSGGLISSGPLKGINFVGPNGTPTPFNFGVVSGLFCIQCDGQDPIRAGQNDPLSVPLERTTLYTRNTYQLTDSIRATAEIEGSHTYLHNSSITSQRDITIKADNAFLDAGLASRMATGGITSFILGTTNQNNLPFFAQPNTKARNQIGNFQARGVRNMYRGVFQLDGDIGENWTWSAHVQFSQNRRSVDQYNAIYLTAYNLAIDAVRVTAANVGTSGQQIGTIVCRSTLTNPTNGCKPLNVMGDGVASQNAIDYVNPPPDSPTAEWSITRVRQLTASASVSGVAFDMPAGPVAVAAGFDFRKDATFQEGNPIGYGVAVYSTGNFQPFDRSATTKEGFGEVQVPLLKDSLVRNFDVNAAVRVTKYATAGTEITWKGGAVSQLTDDIRVRGTVSRDIRAPSVYDLYNPGSYGASSAAIPGQPFAADSQSGGNAALEPERATTYSFGAVLTPQFLPGLTVSADWYNITIKGVIFTPNSQQVFAQCQLGNQAFCAILTRNSLGQVTLVRTVPVNASKDVNKGFDFQADYRFDALGGQMALGITGGYQYKSQTTTPVSDYDNAGSMNLDLGGSGQPKLRATGKLTYNRDALSATIQTRFVGNAKINTQYHVGGGGPLSIDKNDVGWTAYLDLRASYNVTENLQVYTAIDNLLNISPPLYPATSLQSFAGFYPPTSGNYYDLLGTMFRYGVRLRF